MSITRSESHLSQLNKESFDLKTALDAVIDLYSFVAEEKNIEIEASYPSVDFSADRSMFMQAMANLLDNAIKYSEEKSRVLFRVEHKDSHLIVTVQDFGIGISQDDLPRIWERLYRADRSRSKSGLGLGLSIVKIFVDSHNGKAEVISEIEKGTTFRLRLPV